MEIHFSYLFDLKLRCESVAVFNKFGLLRYECINEFNCFLYKSAGQAADLLIFLKKTKYYCDYLSFKSL